MANSDKAVTEVARKDVKEYLKISWRLSERAS
jgi:hypothetical protein